MQAYRLLALGWAHTGATAVWCTTTKARGCDPFFFFFTLLAHVVGMSGRNAANANRKAWKCMLQSVNWSF